MLISSDDSHGASSTARQCFLVTGGFGYTGTWITAHLIEQGHDVYVLTKGDRDLSEAPAAKVIFADLEKQSPETIASLLPDRLNGIVHASSHTAQHEADYARRSILINALGTRNLLQAVLLKATASIQGDAEPVPFPLFLYLSTWHVYGRVEGRITEETPVEPRTDYSLTHFFAEEYCRLYQREHAMPCIVLRLGNCYGAPKPPGRAKWRLLLNDLCRGVHKHGQVTLRGNPDCVRDFIWFGDVARCVAALFAGKDLARQVFNVTYGTGISTGSIAHRVAHVASRYYNKTIPLIINTPDASHMKEQSMPLRELQVSNTSVCNATGITFSDRIDEEIVDILRYLDHHSPPPGAE